MFGTKRRSNWACFAVGALAYQAFALIVIFATGKSAGEWALLLRYMLSA